MGFVDVPAGASFGFLSGNPGSISVGYPQFFEKWVEKFKKYEHFRLQIAYLLNFNAF